MTRIIGALVLLALLFTACGSDEDDRRDQPDAQDPSITRDSTQTDTESSNGGGQESDVGGTYGTDPDLDALWDACEAGDGAACDNLYFQSEIGSEYEAFGDTCGGRFDESPGYCEVAMS